MSTRVTADKKVRRVLALLVVMVVALPVLAVRSYVAKVGESKVAMIPESSDGRLVAIDGRSMLVEPGALEQTMSDWLKSKKDRNISFELSDRSFVAGSAVPSPTTVQRIGQVVRLAKASPALMVHILLPPHPVSAAPRELDEQRAESFRDALTADGISPSHVTIGVDQQNLPTTRTAPLAVLLSK